GGGKGGGPLHGRARGEGGRHPGGRDGEVAAGGGPALPPGAAPGGARPAHRGTGAAQPMSEAQAKWDVEWIMSILPHRYPLLLVDRALEMQPKKRIVAVRNGSVCVPPLGGHFPGRAGTPAVRPGSG